VAQSYITFLKDAARLVAYFVVTLLVGALLAPVLFWSAQGLAEHHILSFLARYDFERFFDRALLITGLLFLWPLLRSLRIENWSELGLKPSRHRSRDLALGFLLAAIPLLSCGVLLVTSRHYSLRNSVSISGLATVLGATIFVPVVEELFFRGLILGILLRSSRNWVAIFLTSAFYSILHFLKAPERTETAVSWTSGLISVTHAFDQFCDPMLVLAGFTTLFLLGWILADARTRTESLWLPIGLHAGWIFSSGLFSKVARQLMVAFPWLGKSLLVGVLPLSIGLLTWLLMRTWLKHEAAGAT
jgi:uncharacterized protein